ncbi:MAG: FHA domain-containing protein [Chromatiales bacterium]|nr:FHA domain-containing protein [Chromatiales bacterium]
MIKLVIRLNGRQTGTVPLINPVTTIGRHKDNQVRLDNLSVSTHHAQVILEGRGCRIEDLGSTNGTRVNNRPAQRQELMPGDVIQIGTYEISVIADIERSDDDNEVTLMMSAPLRSGSSAPPRPSYTPPERRKSNNFLLKLILVLVVLILIVMLAM